jgi:hypothetical protein
MILSTIPVFGFLISQVFRARRTRNPRQIEQITNVAAYIRNGSVPEEYREHALRRLAEMKRANRGLDGGHSPSSIRSTTSPALHSGAAPRRRNRASASK